MNWAWTRDCCPWVGPIGKGLGQSRSTWIQNTYWRYIWKIYVRCRNMKVITFQPIQATPFHKIINKNMYWTRPTQIDSGWADRIGGQLRWLVASVFFQRLCCHSTYLTRLSCSPFVNSPHILEIHQWRYVCITTLARTRFW